FRARRTLAASDVLGIVVGHGKSCPRRTGNASVFPLRTVRALLPCARIEAVPHAGPPRAVAAAAGGGRPFRRDARAGGRLAAARLARARAVLEGRGRGVLCPGPRLARRRAGRRRDHGPVDLYLQQRRAEALAVLVEREAGSDAAGHRPSADAL